MKKLLALLAVVGMMSTFAFANEQAAAESHEAAPAKAHGHGKKAKKNAKKAEEAHDAAAHGEAHGEAHGDQKAH